MAVKTRMSDIQGIPESLRGFLARFLVGTTTAAPTDGTDFRNAAPIGGMVVDETNGEVYKNTGTKASPVWNPLAGVTAGEITLAEGSILQGNASGVAAALAAGTSGKILVGDGTDLASVAVSGDATLAANGAVTIADSVLEGSNVANVADDNVVGGIPVVHRILLASGADANYDVALTHKTRVIDFWIVLKGAGTAGSAVTVQNVTTTIGAVADPSGGSDKDIFRAAAIDDAQQEIAASANLRAVVASTGGDFPGAELYVMGLRVA